MTIDLTEYPFNQLDPDLALELTENLERHNYTPMELAKAQRKVADQLRPHLQQGARNDLKHGKHKKKFRHGLDGAVGAYFHESHTTVHKRSVVLENYERHSERYGTLNLRLNSGQESLSSAYNAIMRDIKRQQFIDAAPKSVMPIAVLLIGDFTKRCGEKVHDNSIDLIFTDPPYDKASLGCYKALAKFGARKLKDGGVLVFYAGQYYLDKIFKIFADEGALQYYWTVHVAMSGRKATIYTRNIFVGWKPLLIYVKGSKPAVDSMFHDSVAPAKAPAKVLHPFEQSTEEAEHFIKSLSYEGQIVCDPMLGTGTTGVAAIKLKRKFIGIEREPSTMRAAKAKIAHFAPQ
jgi:hypothetical protein